MLLKLNIINICTSLLDQVGHINENKHNKYLENKYKKINQLMNKKNITGREENVKKIINSIIRKYSLKIKLVVNKEEYISFLIFNLMINCLRKNYINIKYEEIQFSFPKIILSYYYNIMVDPEYNNRILITDTTIRDFLESNYIQFNKKGKEENKTNYENVCFIRNCDIDHKTETYHIDKAKEKYYIKYDKTKIILNEKIHGKYFIKWFMVLSLLSRIYLCSYFEDLHGLYLYEKLIENHKFTFSSYLNKYINKEKLYYTKLYFPFNHILINYYDTNAITIDKKSKLKLIKIIYILKKYNIFHLYDKICMHKVNNYKNYHSDDE